MQESIQVGFMYFQWKRIHSICGQPVPVFCHSHSKEVFPDVHMELSVLQFVPVAPCYITAHHQKRSLPDPLDTYSIDIYKFL